jgi:hypothetical protein
MTSTPAYRPAYPLDIADSVATIERRLSAFIWEDDSLRCASLRNVLSIFTGRFENVAIIGGMVRDFARVGAPGFHSDVDMVIDAPSPEVAEFAAALGARVNAFGGFSLVRGGWEVDFWPLGSTWALREGHVELEGLQDLIRSTFFDHDAILYDIGRRRVICDDGYVGRQPLNTLEINLMPNPSIHGSLYRAARRILGWELSPGPKLRAFIDEHLDRDAFEHMVATERRKKAVPIIGSFSDVTALRSALS